MGPIDNSGYMVAAYVVAAVVILTYSTSLYLRIRKYRDG